MATSMSKVFADISVSLDGFIAGQNDSVELPLGEGGERLHQWLIELASWRKWHNLSGGETGTDSDIMEESFKNTGAVLMGRRMFDLGEPHWGDDPPFHVPVFVVTHHPREPLVKEGGTTFNFIPDGIESALQQARAGAGDSDVAIAGGANIIQQYLSAGLLDELQIHLVPILLGDGTRLFDQIDSTHLELETTRAIESPGVTHLKFRIGTK